MNQDPQDEPRNKDGKLIRRPTQKFDPFKGTFKKIVPKVGPNEVFEDDDFVPPQPPPAAVEQMKKFALRDSVYKNFFQKMPMPGVLRATLDDAMERAGHAPADRFGDVPDEKKADLDGLLMRLRGMA